MKLKAIYLLVIFTFISACLSSPEGSAPQVTVTSEVTVTLTPTIAPTNTPEPTFTPLPTVTATPEPNTDLTPEQSAQIAGLNEKWNGVLEIDPETFEITSKAGGRASVEGLEYNPETGKIKLTFYSDGLGREFSQIIDPDFIVFGNYEGKPVNVKNIVKALTIGENGQIERVFAKDDGGVTSVPLRTPLELYNMINEDSSDDPYWTKESLEKARELENIAFAEGITVIGTGNRYYLKHDDLYIKILGGNAWYADTVVVRNEESGDFETRNTATYRVVALDNFNYPNRDVAVVYWMGADGELNWELVAGPTNINRMAWQYDQLTDDVLAAYGYGE